MLCYKIICKPYLCNTEIFDGMILSVTRITDLLTSFTVKFQPLINKVEVISS
jgi:hypothetical protein